LGRDGRRGAFRPHASVGASVWVFFKGPMA
jgi:hypothetical protein